MRTKQILYVFVLMCGVTITAIAQCRPPSFHKGRDFINDTGDGSLSIAVQPKDLSIRSLECLITSLRSQHPNWRNVAVLMFTDEIAAYNFDAGAMELGNRSRGMDEEKWASELHATYFFNANQREEFLEIMPLGYKGPPSLDSRIDLPLGDEPPHCSLELDGRCIFDVSRIVYPKEALQAKTSGSVTLQAKITPAGALRAVHVVKNDVKPEETKKILTNAAVQNLSRWRIDPASHESPVRITYSYEILSSSSPKWTDIEFKLPSQVIIRRKPAE